ncbi:NepR family anti-sigma factor [Qipengyuania zhejiangensis]|uniref:NepR family anti-sigma factor n=1 Tax=Qipengyuania zhejiangensis TaxID=3077782 RepID=UPI002D78F819|nr:NepR family anti-sigma factor [Qipengyuania sp. Z2]
MSSPKTDKPGSVTGKAKDSQAQRSPDWANGLRQLYDSVVDEDLPDSFKDLLSQLDAKD